MIGIVIVTYNSEHAIGGCLDACVRLANCETVVVDNASTDDTLGVAKRYGSVHVIANPVNRGFAAAVNQGIRAVHCDAVLLLNPDAVPVRGLDRLRDAVHRPGAGAAGGLLLNMDGSPQHGFAVRGFPTATTLAFEVLGFNRLWPSNPINRRYRQLVPNADVDVDQPAGAFLMIRRSAWEHVGGFDEGFSPVWFEDVDFCRRLRDAGYRIVFEPAAAALHAGGHSVSGMCPTDKAKAWYGSLLRYSAKHHNQFGFRVVAAALVAAAIPRGVVIAATSRKMKAASVYSRVSWLAARCLVSGGAAVLGVPQRFRREPDHARPDGAVVKSSTATK